MLPATSRWLMYLVAALFGLIGALLFFTSNWAAANFPWSISPLTTMTMGAWYLGYAVMACECARIRHWSAIYATLSGIWAFSVLQALLLFMHHDALRLDAVLALPYNLAVLGAASTTAVSIADLILSRPAAVSEGLANPWWSRVVMAAFAVYVAYTAIPLLSGTARGGNIWPESLALLTARCFGVYFLTLVVGVAPLVIARTYKPVLVYMRSSIPMVVLVLIAALVHFDQFILSEQLGGLLYVGLYALAVVGALIFVMYGWPMRSARKMVQPTAGDVR